MAAINYKNFTLNSTGDSAPWGGTEVQFHKDIIDACVKDSYSALADTTNGHRHYRVYDTSGVVCIRCPDTGIQRLEYSDSVYCQFTTASNGDTTIKNTGGDIYFTDASGNASLTIENDRDYVFTLGDASGARMLYVKDNANSTQASIDSDGNAYFKGDIYTTQFVAFDANPQGFSTTSILTTYYKKIGKTVAISCVIVGTSNAAGKSITLPFALNGNSAIWIPCVCGADNGVGLTTPGSVQCNTNSTTLTIYKDASTTTWTTSGGCEIRMNFSYETA